MNYSRCFFAIGARSCESRSGCFSLFVVRETEASPPDYVAQALCHVEICFQRAEGSVSSGRVLFPALH